jgi:4-carboxymuconolactone decarboxylase
MTRLRNLKPADMSPEQAAVYRDIEKSGGRLGGPYTAYIRIPRFMRLNQDMGDYLRSNSLPARLRSLIVLNTVKHWGAQYAFAVNKRSALREGVEKDVVEAIEQGREPKLTDPRDITAVAVARELLQTRTLSEKTYREAVEVFGEDSLVDVVVTTGFYSMVSMTLNAFDVDPPSA